MRRLNTLVSMNLTLRYYASGADGRNTEGLPSVPHRDLRRAVTDASPARELVGSTQQD